MTRLALELAAIGVGRVSPSPLVGCVIVAANGEIAGEGTYIYENVTHAEVIALKEAGKGKRRDGVCFARTALASRADEALHRSIDKCRNQARRLPD